MPEVLLLSGPSAAGKTSLAQALAARYDRVAHIPVDVLRHLITPTGYASFGKPDFGRQRSLARRNACDLACNFIAERYAVIVDDIGAEEELDAYVELLKPAAVPVHHVRLLPSLDVCLRRNQARREGRTPPERVSVQWQEFASRPLPAGAAIDSSELTVEATADRLQALTTSGASLVWRPGPS